VSARVIWEAHSGLRIASYLPRVIRLPFHFLCACRFLFAAFAPSLPSAVRVVLGRCATVLFFFATATAFLMFFLAAAFCAAVI
jgi:hypothetical protein